MDIQPSQTNRFSLSNERLTSFIPITGQPAPLTPKAYFNQNGEKVNTDTIEIQDLSGVISTLVYTQEHLPPENMVFSDRTPSPITVWQLLKNQKIEEISFKDNQGYKLRDTPTPDIKQIEKENSEIEDSAPTPEHEEPNTESEEHHWEKLLPFAMD